MDVAQQTAPSPAQRIGPTALWMHLAFILTGFATLLLGPILPLLTHQWHLQDAQSGLLFAAQFYAACFGGLTVAKDLQRSIVIGMAAASVGFGIFALVPSIVPACIGLAIGGYGVGQTITAVNILAGRRATQHRGAALAFLNFSWSFGALLSPVLAAWLTPHFRLRSLLAAFATAFLVLLLLLLVQLKGAEKELVAVSNPADSSARLPARLFAVFLGLLILYGGLETCLGGWLTTYSLRYANQSLAFSEYTLVLFLGGLTAGRAASSLILRVVGERLLLRLSLAIAVLLTAALATTHTATGIAVSAVLLGIALAPFFPVTFALLIAEQPTARQAGIILAGSALGAAMLPWLMGVISTHTGSLKVALVLPMGAALALLAVGLLLPPAPPAFPPSSSV